MNPIEAYRYTLEYLARDRSESSKVVERIEREHTKKGEYTEKFRKVSLQELSPDQQLVARQIAKTKRIAEDSANPAWQAVLWACSDYQQDQKKNPLAKAKVSPIRPLRDETQAHEAIIGTANLIDQQRQSMLQRHPSLDEKNPKYALYGTEERVLPRLGLTPPEIFKQIDRKAIEYHLPMLNVLAPHTMSMRDYLDARFSKALQTKIAFADEIEILQGSAKDFYEIYQGKFCILYTNPSSYKIASFYFEKDGKLLEKVVLYNVFSEARTNNAILLIKYIRYLNHGKNDSMLCIRGNIKQIISEKSKELSRKLQSLLIFDKNILIVGARELPSKAAVNAGFVSVNKEEVLGEFKFDILTSLERKKGVVALRMPNGDLAYYVMRDLLHTNKFDHVIMVGAGGALSAKNVRLGDYLVLNEASKDGDSIKLPNRHKKIVPEGNYVKKDRTNITVDSPLEENEQWLMQYKDIDSVDVETFHIFKAISEYGEPLKVTAGTFIPVLQVTPGLFISDIVGEHPLIEKINVENAWVHLEEMVTGLLRKG